MRPNSLSRLFLEMLEGEGAGDYFAPCVGFALGLLVAGFERLQLGVELFAFPAEEFQPIGRGLARHRSVRDSVAEIYAVIREAWRNHRCRQVSRSGHPERFAKGALMHYLRQCSDGRGVPLHPHTPATLPAMTLQRARSCRGDLFAAG